MTDHSEFLTRLRSIERFTEALPDTYPTPHVTLDLSQVTVGLWFSDDTAVKVRDLARLIGGRWHKNDPAKSNYDASYYILRHDVKLPGDVEVRIICQREEVCERVQVGTEKVTVEAKPAVAEHEEERPVFEYQCIPLNAKANAIDLDRELAELTA